MQAAQRGKQGTAAVAEDTAKPAAQPALSFSYFYFRAFSRALSTSSRIVKPATCRIFEKFDYMEFCEKEGK